MSTIFRDVKTRGGARAAVLLLWIMLIFSQLGLHFCAHEDFRPADPRKARFFDAASNSFHAPSSSAEFGGGNGSDDPDTSTVYGDDKRIVHTGPNPLHN